MLDGEISYLALIRIAEILVGDSVFSYVLQHKCWSVSGNNRYRGTVAVVLGPTDACTDALYL